MNPRLLNKFKNKSFILSLAVVFFILLLAFLVPFLKIPSSDILKSPLGLLTLIRREAAGIIFFHHNMAQNERLRKEADLLRQKLNEANEVYLENERLRKLLSLKEKPQLKVIAARVIGRSMDSWPSQVIINKGRHSGIKRGSVAITYLGLAGRVIEAANFTSKVILINDPEFAVSAMAQRSRQEGLISGSLGHSLFMKYLPNDSDIEVSDVIITSGLTENFPKGLLIGTVVSIGDELSGLSRYAVVKPAVNLSSIEEVLIIAQ